MYNGFVNWIYSIQKELSNVSTIITVPNRSTVSSFDRLHEHLRLKQFGSFLLNLRLLNWLRPSFNLVRNFRFIGLKILSLEFGEGQWILSRLFLNDGRFQDFRILISSLHYSEITKRKNDSWKHYFYIDML